MLLKIKKLSAIPTPKYSRDGDAALDLHAVLPAAVTLKPGQRLQIPSGLALAIPSGHVGLMMPRGGLGTKGLNLANSTGVIDSNYRGEIMITVVNTGEADITIQPLDRIMQLTIVPIAICEIEEVAELDETTRNEGRFGSSGR